MPLQFFMDKAFADEVGPSFLDAQDAVLDLFVQTGVLNNDVTAQTDVVCKFNLPSLGPNSIFLEKRVPGKGFLLFPFFPSVHGRKCLEVREAV